MNKKAKLLFIYIIIGPLIGLALFTREALIDLIASGNFNLFSGGLFAFYIIVATAYFVGLPPAITSGLLYLYPTHMIGNKYIRIALSLPIGASSMIAWTTGSMAGFASFFEKSLLNTVLFGSVVSLICAILTEWERRPSLK